MECVETGCTNEVRYKNPPRCRTHYERHRQRNNIDKLHIRPCAGACGKRVHNAKYVVVPGVVQGHGPGMAWCTTCNRVYKPTTTRKDFGPCKCCEKPMMSGILKAGFVQYWGRGFCKSCYYRDGMPPKDRHGEGNNQAKLTTAEVIEIRRLYDAGESCVSIARIYNTGPNNVGKIGRRKTWTHI